MLQALSNRITEKFGTQAAFGLNVGWVPQKVYRMLNEEYEPKLSEAAKISCALEISIDELASFFEQ